MTQHPETLVVLDTELSPEFDDIFDNLIEMASESSIYQRGPDYVLDMETDFVRKNNDLRWHQGPADDVVDAWTLLTVGLIASQPAGVNNLKEEVRAELKRAKDKFGWWPADHLHATLITSEEVLEWLTDPQDEEEYIQALAMCMRFFEKMSA